MAAGLVQGSGRVQGSEAYADLERALPGGGGSGLTSSQLDLARAILSAVEHGAHIINISGGQLTPSGEAEPILAQAVETCLRRNVLIVAAAGNDGCDCLHVPAAAPSVLAVGAIDHLGAPLASSNWGAAYLAQGVLAPGMAVIGAAPGGGTVSKSGTSFATPYVSGVCALLAAAQLARGEAPETRTGYARRSCATRNPARITRPWAAKSSWPAASISKQPSETSEGDTT